jgi:hypothetical protein
VTPNSLCLPCHLTIVGADRDTLMELHRRDWDLSGDRSTLTLERVMHNLRLLVLTAILLGGTALMTRSVAHSLRTGRVALRGGLTCRRSTRPFCFWFSIVVTVLTLGFFIAAWVYVMFLAHHPA